MRWFAAGNGGRERIFREEREREKREAVESGREQAHIHMKLVTKGKSER